jgi:OmpA-OmpF porin, OOP family
MHCPMALVRCIAAGALTLAALRVTHAEKAGLDLGLFVGGDVFGDNIELGNSFFPDQVPSDAVLAGLRAGLRVHHRLAVEVEAKVVPSSTNGIEGRPSISTIVVGYRAHAMALIEAAPRLEAFVLLGAGLETAFFDSPPAALAIDSPDTDPSVHWGLGASYLLGASRHLGARVDLRQALAAGRDPSLTFTHELHLGLFARFDTFGSDRVIVERIVKERQLLPVIIKAAPLDSDQDGIPDDEDQCPTQAEIFNQIDDTDGCPEVDSDNDGLLGTRDQCPDSAEDFDGFEDDDGCPDPDNDADGRPDLVDQCPMEAEVLNGFQDDDGCPDEVPQKLQRFTGVIQGIQFGRGSTKILGSSRSVLKAAVAVFKEYPDLRIEISGHSDITGNFDTNMELSRKRADAAKWQLVDLGIDAARIFTLGFGPNRPIADNGTEEGRKKNRRIEFRLLPGPKVVQVDPEGNIIPQPPELSDLNDPPAGDLPAPDR